MQTRTPPITRHKVARLFAWAQLWLVGFVAACIAWGGAIPRRTLDRVARRAHILIVCAAVSRGLPGRPSRNRHGRKKHVTRRIVIGARLRAATRGKSWQARIFAILALIRDAERHIARLMRRLRRGLSRLRILYPARADAPRFSSALTPLAAADCS